MVYQRDRNFEQRMRPAAQRVYERLFTGCSVEFAAEDDRLKQLDASFGIDAILRLKTGQIITTQQKFRRHENLSRYGDFTQEFRNAADSKHEAEGEWFYLAAQLYLYGWANEDESDFAAWVLLDVVRYKLLVEGRGGLEKVGRLRHNQAHGRASFYAIPLEILKPAILRRSGI